jgi:hypothetical protein
MSIAASTVIPRGTPLPSTTIILRLVPDLDLSVGFAPTDKVGILAIPTSNNKT